MKHQTIVQLCAFVGLATVAMVFAKNNYLAEKPDFIKSCKRTDPKFNSCFGRNLQVIFKEWKDGVPGLSSVGSVDPLYVKRVGVTQVDNNPLVQMNVELLNVKLIGISEVQTKDINIDFDKLIVTAKIRAPKLESESDYIAKGRLLLLPLNGNGKGYVKIDDLNMNIQMHLKLRDEFSHTFADVDKLKLEIWNIGGFHIDLKNLFNGQKQLEESTNKMINQSWREFYAVLGPAIKDKIQSIMYDRFKKIYAYVPATYFIEDIPTAAEYYG